MVEHNALETEFTSLRAEFGKFPVEHDTAELSEESFERVCDLDERGIHGAARVWVQRNSETLLVRERSRPDSWGVAGGLVEPGEHSNETGYREVLEETGIECAIHDVAYGHVTEYRSEYGSETIEQYAVAFVANYVDGAIEVQESEIVEAGWFETPPESVHPPATRIGSERLGWNTGESTVTDYQ